MTDFANAAVVGIGQMGRGIARNIDARKLLCAASDLEPDAFAEADFSDRVKQTDFSEILDVAEIILFAVPSTTQITQILEAHQGRKEQLIVDLTTSHPGQSQALDVDLKARGFCYVDAAMTGGATGADAGSLTLMAGGSEEHLARCRPVFDAFAAKVFHMGSVGSGHAMKLVHNLILHSSFLATCEGVRLAERAGIDPNLTVQVLNAGNARSFVTETRFPRDILSGTMMARSQISNLEKDLGLAQDFANELGARIPYGRMTRSVLANALTAGHEDTDFSWLFPLYDELVAGMENDK
jgi:3-hydroxyisobutyrate dehydrogenase